MSCLKIIKFPDSSLRRKGFKVEAVTDAERKELVDMAQTMYLNSGVGLAATQVGISKQLAVIDVGSGLVKLVNPTIVKKAGLEIYEEGCLSVPNVSIKVKRSKNITVDFLDEYGKCSRIQAEGLFARAIQHEIDHLCGRLIIDYLNPIKRLFLIKRISQNRSQRTQ